MRRAWLILMLVGACAVLAGCGGSWSQSTASGDEAGGDEGAPPMQAANGPVDEPPLARPLRLRLAGARNAFPDPFRKPPRAALLFDLDSGEVLWRRSATRDLPIASVTKLMTALLVVAGSKPTDRVRITKQALAYQGSGVGLLPRHRTVQLETMLYGLLLASGNDAAIALAQHVSGTVPKFVERMNSQARALGLRCTRFDSPSGFEEVRLQRQARNRSCPADLAVLARAVLDRPRLARIVRTRMADRPFPIKGGRIQLYNHNPLLKARYPGTIGFKTGFTNVAGRSLVAGVERDVDGRRRRLGVVLLHSPDPGRQAKALLERGFRALGAR